MDTAVNKISYIMVRVGSGFNLLDVKAFWQMPQHQRIELIRQDKLLFVDARGATVSPRIALPALAGST